MHILDGVIESPVVLAGTWGVTALGIGLASRGFVHGAREEHAPIVGVLGAFIFAAQMVNFAIPGMPVSAHLTGTVLLTVILGPSPAIVVSASVLLVQALLFQDGGVLAYGANVTNLAVLPALVAAALLRALPQRLRHSSPSIALMGAAGVAASSGAVALELVFGSSLDPAVVATGLLAVQGVVAVAEGIITALVLVSIRELLGGRLNLWSPGSPGDSAVAGAAEGEV